MTDFDSDFYLVEFETFTSLITIVPKSEDVTKTKDVTVNDLKNLNLITLHVAASAQSSVV